MNVSSKRSTHTQTEKLTGQVQVGEVEIDKYVL